MSEGKNPAHGNARWRPMSQEHRAPPRGAGLVFYLPVCCLTQSENAVTSV